MEHITDPKIRMIMDKLNQNDAGKDARKGDDSLLTIPPKTFEQFLKAEYLV